MPIWKQPISVESLNALSAGTAIGHLGFFFKQKTAYELET